jgi:predicted KAP-like P-loop ATPase
MENAPVADHLAPQFTVLWVTSGEVSTAVVFVDDLHRCLPETIIDTFETIRLFLHVRETGYVIAAHPRIVEAAIDSRYEANKRETRISAATIWERSFRW